MSTLHITSTSIDDTWRIAGELGSRLRGGEVIELTSDLGGGKTAFVQGLAKGAGSVDRVSSPSFTLRNEYSAGKLTIYHFDFYRLSEPGIMSQELAETLEDPEAVTVVEWADIIEDVLPAEHLTIKIIATSEEGRELIYEFPDKLSYLVETKGKA